MSQNTEPSGAVETVDMEVFRAGRYPQGAFSEADLEEMAAAYDPAVHEAPVTLDHARSGPALGWVESVRRVGDRLVARLRGVSEGLRQLVRSGAYRKRSAEIYLDFNGSGRKYLRAVTFLGAGVPEVKGLAEASFDEQGGAFTAVPCDLKPSLTALLKRRLSGLLRLLESQPEAAVEAKPEARPDQSASFAEELQRAREQAQAELESERRELERERRAHEAAVFLERLEGEGRLLPAWSQGLAAFIEHMDGLEHMEGLEQGETVAFFSEAGTTPVDWFRAWLAGLPHVVHFEEAAPEGSAAPVDAASRLEELTLERMRLRPHLTFGEAFREVCSAQPGLAADYLDEVS